MSSKLRQRTAFQEAAQWAIGFTWRHETRLALLHSILLLFDSAIPALQVFCMVNLTQALSKQKDSSFFWWIIAAAATVGAARGINDFGMTTGQVLSRRIGARAQAAIAATLAATPPELIASGHYTTQARAARDAIDSHVSHHYAFIMNSLRALATMGFLMIPLWSFSPLAAILIAACVIPTLAAFGRVSKIEARAWPKMARQSKYANYFADQLTYERTAFELASLGTATRLAIWVRDRYKHSAAIFGQMMFRSSIWIGLAGIACSLLLGFALFILCSSPTNTAAAVAAGVIAVLSGMSATSDAGYTLGSVVGGTPMVATYVDFTRETNRALPSRNATASAVARRLVRLDVDAVSFTYPGRETPALSEATLSAVRGEMIALVGSNGAGKTTLVRVLTGLNEASSGKVSFDGVALANLSDAERLASIGLLSQEFGRYELTVRDAVALGTPRHDVSDDEIWDALDVAKARDIVEALPGGLDAQLGQQWDGVGLSGGQWQRLALARIALRRAPLWVLDEPTSSVDAETEALIFDDLGRSRAERITVVVSHRAWTLKSMDRIYVLDAGRIVQVGTYAELIARPGRFQEMFTEQVSEGIDVG